MILSYKTNIITRFCFSNSSKIWVLIFRTKENKITPQLHMRKVAYLDSYSLHKFETMRSIGTAEEII
jgi:hypothetical protein